MHVNILNDCTVRNLHDLFPQSVIFRVSVLDLCVFSRKYRTMKIDTRTDWTKTESFGWHLDVTERRNKRSDFDWKCPPETAWEVTLNIFLEPLLVSNSHERKLRKYMTYHNSTHSEL